MDNNTQGNDNQLQEDNGQAAGTPITPAPVPTPTLISNAAPAPTSQHPVQQSTGENQADQPAPSIDEILALEPKNVSELSKEHISSMQKTDTKVDASTESKRIRWKCRNCGYQYEGYQKLTLCPRCGKDSSYFEDTD